jgi:hypothetical protein
VKIEILCIRFILIIFSVILCTLSSCKKDDELTGFDRQLFDMANITTGFVWFKNSDILLNRSSESGHGNPYLRTRYNIIASSKLDINGKIIPGSVFPDSSLIVKELFNEKREVVRYAILFKKTGDVNADAKGWVWGYYDLDETVAQSVTRKGVGCNDCHSQPNNIDYMLMNIYFP